MLRTGFTFVLLLFALVTFSQSDTSNANKASRKIIIPKYERTKGYAGWVETGIDFLPVQGRTHPYNGFPTPSLIIFNGARLNRNITLGLELGIHLGTYISVNPMMRYNLYLKPRIALLFDFSAGYAFALLNDYNEHGFNFNPSIGFKIWGKKGKAAVTFRVGYTGIYSKEYPGSNNTIEPSNYVRKWNYYSGIYAAVGIEF